MKMKHFLRAGLVLALVAMPAGLARGATATGQLTVTATVASGCALGGGQMNFGQYTSGQPGNLDVTGSIDYINCPVGILKFELDGGGSGNETNREMSSGSNKLKYQLFRDPNRTANFGSGTSAQQVQLLVNTSGKVSVYGRIPGNQNVAPGNYSDTVTITLTF
jgi:spore coat protein U-like protein